MMRQALVCVVVWLVSIGVFAADAQPLQFPRPYPHSTLAVEEGPATTTYLLGLGAMQKIGGRWRHKHAEEIEGEVLRLTWEIEPDYTAEEAFAWMRKQLTGVAQVLFECTGRSCGSSAQWASRVFHQRLLYGHDERQQYLVTRVEQDGATYTYVLYAIDRANRRQYMHLDRIRHSTN